MFFFHNLRCPPSPHMFWGEGRDAYTFVWHLLKVSDDFDPQNNLFTLIWKSSVLFCSSFSITAMTMIIYVLNIFSYNSPRQLFVCLFVYLFSIVLQSHTLLLELLWNITQGIRNNTNPYQLIFCMVLLQIAQDMQQVSSKLITAAYGKYNDENFNKIFQFFFSSW